MITLFPYQQPVVPSIVEILRDNRLAILNGDVGVGKTVMALEIARQAGVPKIAVVCPKIVKTAWARTADAMGVPLAWVETAEALRTGNRPHMVTRNGNAYQYQLPQGSLIILDELHRFGAQDSLMAYLMFGVKLSACKALGLTGTLGESPLRFRGILSLLDLVSWHNYPGWLLKHGCYRDRSINGSPWAFTRGAAGTKYMQELHDLLFPKYGVRMRSSELPDYPKMQTRAEVYDLDPAQAAEVDKLYEEMAIEVKHPFKAAADVTRLLRCRQQVEWIKTVMLRDLTKELVDEGNSVPVFFNFRDSMERFAYDMRNLLGQEIPVIHGDQTQKERDAAIETFQSNRCPVIAAIVQAGGVGVNLGDEGKGRPRVALINMPLDSQNIIQAAGRVHRSTNKLPASAIVPMLAGSQVEERLCVMLRNKLRNLADVQGDLLSAVLLETK